MADLEKPASSLDPRGLPKDDQESTSWEGETMILRGASSKNRLCIDFVHRLEKSIKIKMRAGGQVTRLTQVTQEDIWSAF